MRKLNNPEMRSYAGSIDAKLYPYFCAETGELAGNLRYVIWTTVSDWRRCRIRHAWQRMRSWQKWRMEPFIRHGSLFLPRSLVILNSKFVIHKQEAHCEEVYAVLRTQR